MMHEGCPILSKSLDSYIRRKSSQADSMNHLDIHFMDTASLTVI